MITLVLTAKEKAVFIIVKTVLMITVGIALVGMSIIAAIFYITEGK